MTERNKFLQSRKANASLKNFLNDVFQIDLFLEGMTKREVIKGIVCACVAGAFAYGVLVVLFAALG